MLGLELLALLLQLGLRARDEDDVDLLDRQLFAESLANAVSGARHNGPRPIGLQILAGAQKVAVESARYSHQDPGEGARMSQGEVKARNVIHFLIKCCIPLRCLRRELPSAIPPPSASILCALVLCTIQLLSSRSPDAWQPPYSTSRGLPLRSWRELQRQ